MLEEKIQKLTIAIDALTAVIMAYQAQVAIAAQHPDAVNTRPAVIQEAPEAVATPAITRETLQEWALAQVRQDKAFKPRLVDAIGKYSAKTISQLPDDAAAVAIYKQLGGAA